MPSNGPSRSPRAYCRPRGTRGPLRRSGRRADEIEQLQVLAGLDREHVERQVAVGLAQARAGTPELAVLTLGTRSNGTRRYPCLRRSAASGWTDAEARNDRPALSKALEALERAASDPERHERRH